MKNKHILIIIFYCYRLYINRKGGGARELGLSSDSKEFVKTFTLKFILETVILQIINN